jgi:hypothetical protein
MAMRGLSRGKKHGAGFGDLFEDSHCEEDGFLAWGDD